MIRQTDSFWPLVFSFVLLSGCSPRELPKRNVVLLGDQSRLVVLDSIAVSGKTKSVEESAFVNVNFDRGKFNLLFTTIARGVEPSEYQTLANNADVVIVTVDVASYDTNSYQKFAFHA